ncbi:MAG: asparagine synthase-related protein [Alphaproteobacteria bacterium]|jgi:asparagine synthetase B (glutamine-hydrolysing)|nr:asparagine synthase-related protein [Alphaproteobacteria bacterium]
MIGLFGHYRSDAEAPVTLAAMAGSVRGLAVHAPASAGCAIGRAAHRHEANLGIANGGDLSVLTLGEASLPGGEEDLATAVLRLAETGDLDGLAEANGMFCAAVYDGARHRLTLVTDHLASFPIHLWRGEGEIVFAGQIFTLIANPAVPRRADRAGLAQLFTLQRTIGRTTSVAEVEALPAACIWEIDREGQRERAYWQLAWRRPDFDVAAGARRLAGAMRNAVARQSRGKAALLLSGGLDSRMVLAAAPRGSLDCWTTASYADNPELALAERTAAMFDAAHRPLIVEPADTLAALEMTVIESNGLYPASTPMSAFLPTVGSASEAVLTGHGLDYTLRGYYLPARFLEVAGSRTRLPWLKSHPARPRGADVLRHLRQGPPRVTVERIVVAGARADWWAGLESAMEETLAPWLDSDEPYDAWDAFILHALSKHYAFTGMMAVRAVANLRLPAFDREVFDIYLQMPPAWRCSGRMAQLALRELSPQAARLANANTHFRADLSPWAETAALLGRGVLRRLGLAQRQAAPSAQHSTSSWQSLDALYRDDVGHRARFGEIRARLDGLGFGVLDTDGLAACIDEHLDGRRNHTKLLRQLLTHDAWVREFAIA